MRSLTVFTAPWYPGHDTLLEVVEAAREQLEEKEVPIEVVDVEGNLQTAEKNRIVSVPTVVLYKDDEEKRRLTGAAGLPEILGLAGIKSRARKLK